MSNILDLYNRVIKNIANEIQLTLSPEQQIQLDKAREVNPEAYEAYLRGMYHIHQLTQEGMAKGLEYLHEAVRIDPAEPFAYAGLAMGYLEIAQNLDPLNPLYTALLGALGKMDEAFKWLAYEPHHLWVPWVAVMPMWNPLHEDVRWKEFVTSLKLPK